MSDADARPTGLKKDNGRRTVAAETAAHNRVVQQTIGQNRRTRRNNLRIDRQRRRAEQRAADTDRATDSSDQATGATE